MKTRLELKLGKDEQPFEVIDALQIEGKVYRANVVDFETVVIYYDSRKITEFELKAAIRFEPESKGEKLKMQL